MTLTARAMQQYGPYMHDHGRSWDHPWLALLFLVVVIAAIGVGVWALVHGGRTQYLATPMAPPGTPTDPAIDALRMRFARGEIDAAEYASRVAHLSGATPPDPGPS